MRTRGLLCTAAPFLFFLGVSVAACFWTPFSQEWMDLRGEYLAPSWGHWLGQGENGVDVLSHCMLGVRNSVFWALLTVFSSGFIGALFGFLGAYCRGWIDLFLCRLVDFFNAFPGLVLFMLVVTVLGSGFGPLFLAMLLVEWSDFARVLRLNALSALREPYVEAAKAQGAGPLRLLFVHVLPQLWPSLSTQFFLSLRRVIVAESALSFLGLGFKAETASLGRLLGQGREALLFAPHLMFVPGALLFFLLLSVMRLGDKVQSLWRPASS